MPPWRIPGWPSMPVPKVMNVVVSSTCGSEGWGILYAHMHERMVSGVLRVDAKSESSREVLGIREPGMRKTWLGRETSEAVHGIRWKGALVSEGAIVKEKRELV